MGVHARAADSSRFLDGGEWRRTGLKLKITKELSSVSEPALASRLKAAERRVIADTARVDMTVYL